MAIPSQNIDAGCLVIPGTPLVGSGTAAAASQAVTITAASGQTPYVLGFAVTGTGATAASGVNVTLSDGTLTMNFAMTVVAGASSAVTAFNYTFQYPFPASGTGKTWTLTVPSFGSGNALASATLYGFEI